MASNLRIIGRNVLLMTVTPSIPIVIWYRNAQEERRDHELSVKHKMRIPNVETIDDMMVSKCLPGDIILFDRRCHKCCAGPLSVVSCVIGRGLLCSDEMDMVEAGKYDHVGIVVPGKDSVEVLE